jgi:hypothetical protein
MATQFDMALTWRLAVYTTLHTHFFADFGNTHHRIPRSPLLVIFPQQLARSGSVLAIRDWLHRGNNHHGYELFGQFYTSETEEHLSLLSLMFLFFDASDAGMFRLCWGGH